MTGIDIRRYIEKAFRGVCCYSLRGKVKCIVTPSKIFSKFLNLSIFPRIPLKSFKMYRKFKDSGTHEEFRDFQISYIVLFLSSGWWMNDV